MWSATLFPDPVAPAIRRWGIFPRSRTTGSPKMSFPMASDSAGTAEA